MLQATVLLQRHAQSRPLVDLLRQLYKHVQTLLAGTMFSTCVLQVLHYMCKMGYVICIPISLLCWFTIHFSNLKESYTGGEVGVKEDLI